MMELDLIASLRRARTQEAAKQVLPSKAFAYYSSGGTDEYTLGLNR